MPYREWPEKLRQRIEENLPAAIEGLSDEDLQEAIRNAIDLRELIREVFNEEPTVKATLKTKLIEELGTIVDDIENHDFSGESFEEFVKSVIDIENEARIMLMSNDELILTARTRLKEVLIEEIQKFDGSDLPEWEGLVGMLDVDGAIEKIVPTEEFQIFFTELVLKVLKQDVEDSFDSDDTPDWEKMMVMMGKDDVIKKLLQGERVKAILEERIIEFLSSRIDETVSSADIPDDLMRRLDIKEKMRVVLEDPATKAALAEKATESIKTMIGNMASGRDLNLASLLLEDPAMKKFATRSIEEMLRDEKIAKKIRENIWINAVGQAEQRSAITSTVLRRMFRI